MSCMPFCILEAVVYVLEITNRAPCTQWVLGTMFCMLLCIVFCMFFCILLCILEAVEGELRLLKGASGC